MSTDPNISNSSNNNNEEETNQEGPPKMILNGTDTAVSDMMQGVLLQQPYVRALEAPYSNVFLLNPSLGDESSSQDPAVAVKLPPRSSVALISGGGSGHEPSHAGWLGLLDSVVCGNVFASPSVSSILAALLAVPQTHVVCLVKNYTGDKLNFAMAAQKCMTLDPNKVVQCVVIADDVAIPRHKGSTGARGVAGTVLVHKIASAAAMISCETPNDRCLEYVVQMAQQATSRMGTLGLALDPITVPGSPTRTPPLPPNTMELGLGIHGESGLKQCSLQTATELASTLVTELQDYGRVEDSKHHDNDKDKTKIVPLFEEGDEMAVLINNLGGTSEFEMNVFTAAVLHELQRVRKVLVSRLYVGTYMTSFALHGVSVTLLNLTTELKQLLDVPAPQCPQWKPAILNPTVPEPLPAPTILSHDDDPKNSMINVDSLPPCDIKDFATLAHSMVQQAAKALIQAEPVLTQYDTIVGDGDCGFTMKRGATQLLNVLVQPKEEESCTKHPGVLYSTVAQAISTSMGGTSGALLELAFWKMARTVASSRSNITQETLWQAFRDGVNEIQSVGGAQVGDRTLLDALVPATQCQTLADAAKAARSGAEGTAQMSVAQAGRSNYLSQETLTGTPDPGAIAMAIVLEAMADVVA